MCVRVCDVHVRAWGCVYTNVCAYARGCMCVYVYVCCVVLRRVELRCVVLVCVVL